MNYKEILKLKYPTKQPIRFVDSTYEGIIWNPLDQTPNPSKVELDDAISQLLNNTINALPVTDLLTGEVTNYSVVIPAPIVKVISFHYATIGTMSGTSVIAVDNSVPLVTEGTRVASLAITPASLTSKMKCSFDAVCDSSTNNRNIVLALFRDNTCINVSAVNVASSGRTNTITIDFIDVPNTTAQVTYSLRVGISQPSVWYLNSNSSNRNFGGKMTSTFMITEFA
jgi:hypothetical protein